MLVETGKKIFYLSPDTGKESGNISTPDVRCKTIETSMFHVNPNSFTGRLIIGTFEKRAPGHYVPYSVRTVYGFFNVSQNCHLSKWSETGLTVYRL